MSVTITAISNTDTFGTWKTKTNDLITVAAKAVTMGDANAGNIALNGDITLESGHTITVDNIVKTDGGSQISLKSPTKVEGDLTIDNGTGVAKIQIARSASNKWTIETNSTHSELMIKETGGNFIKFTSTAITSTGMTIAEAMLPQTVTRKIVHTGTGSSGSSFADCDIAAGNITGLSTLGTSGNPIASSVLTSVDINGGTIDGTAIGGTTKAAGAFTNVTASGTITATGGFIGNINGDIDGNITGNVSGTASGLTGTALTEVLKAVYPIGALYTSTSDISPAGGRTSGATSGLGFGSWERYAEGRVLVSKDEGLVVTAASASAATDQGVFTTGTISHGFSIGEKVSFLGMGGQNTLAGDPSSSLSYPTGAALFTSNYGGVVIANGLTATSFRVQFSNVSTGSYQLNGNSIVVRSWCQQVNSTSASSQGGQAVTTDLIDHEHHVLRNGYQGNGDIGITHFVSEASSNNNGDYLLRPGDSGEAFIGRSSPPISASDPSESSPTADSTTNLQPYKTVSIWRRIA